MLWHGRLGSHLRHLHTILKCLVQLPILLQLWLPADVSWKQVHWRHNYLGRCTCMRDEDGVSGPTLAVSGIWEVTPVNGRSPYLCLPHSAFQISTNKSGGKGGFQLYSGTVCYASTSVGPCTHMGPGWSSWSLPLDQPTSCCCGHLGSREWKILLFLPQTLPSIKSMNKSLTRKCKKRVRAKIQAQIL